MKVFVFSDTHSNLEALEEVFARAREHKPDIIASLGDVVGYGADPAGCVELVDEKADIKICGNHDLAAAGIIDTSDFNRTASLAIDITRGELGRDHIRRIRKYSRTESRDGMLFAHSSPLSPMDFDYVYTVRQAKKIFSETAEKFIFIGHTHIPGVISDHPGEGTRIERGTAVRIDPDSRYLINAGSVGQPRDGIKAASYIVVDMEKGLIDMERTAYDIMSAQAKIREKGLPESLAARLATAR